MTRWSFRPLVLFTKELEKESSHLGSKITKIVSNISNSDLGDLEKKISQLEITTSIRNDKLSSQPDLDVTTHDNIINDSNYHDSASHSVHKPTEEPEIELEKSHSTFNDQSNTSIPADESQVSNINSTKVIKVNKTSKS